MSEKSQQEAKTTKKFQQEAKKTKNVSKWKKKMNEKYYHDVKE